ncbi:MAG: hypothetical protein GY750_08280 [Lentisphaerae bacterium]|nr:hypothetical protein [Lentisphaerota bacterium]
MKNLFLLIAFIPITTMVLVVEYAFAFELEDKEHYAELKRNGTIVKAYEFLKSQDLSGNSHMLAERGLLYFDSPKGVVEKCAAVKDLEQAMSGGAKYVRPFLDYIYNGAWMAVAAEEGVQQAQRLLGLSLFENLLNKTNSMASINKKRTYEKAYKYFNAAVREKTRITDENFVNTLKLAAKNDGIAMELEFVKPRKLFCPPRY